MKKTILKHLPIIFYIIYLLIIIISSWTIKDLGLGLIIPFITSYLFFFIISIYYGYKSLSKRKYILPIFFWLSSYLLDGLCFIDINNLSFNFSSILIDIKEAIINGPLFIGISLLGLLLGILVRKIKEKINKKM